MRTKGYHTAADKAQQRLDSLTTGTAIVSVSNGSNESSWAVAAAADERARKAEAEAGTASAAATAQLQVQRGLQLQLQELPAVVIPLLSQCLILRLDMPCSAWLAGRGLMALDC